MARAKADFGRMHGLVLSHAIGICLLLSLLLDRVIQEKLLYWTAVQVPLLLVGFWLLLNRSQRIGRVKIGLWDYLYLGFVSMAAVGSVYADSALIRFSGFQNYLQFVVTTLHPYLFFVVVREAANRQGFRPLVILGWFLAAICASGLIGLMQARDLLGVRQWSYVFYNQRIAEMAMDGPSAIWQAKGATVHANILAQHTWLGLCVLVGLACYRGIKKVDIFIGLVLLATLAATYSRSGVITTTAIGAALVIFLMSRRQYRSSFLVLLGGAILAVAGVTAIYAFNVERLKILVEGEGTVRRPEELGSLRMRVNNSVKALRLGQEYPVFGLMAAAGGINDLRTITRNAYTFEGKLDNMYSFTFVMHGFVGVGFMLGILYGLFRTIRSYWAPCAFSGAVFLSGVGLAVHGNTENLLFTDGMLIINVLMALVVMRIAPLRAAKAPEHELSGIAPQLRPAASLK
ncbi:MAG TPA: O-antigen ligase family protein [Fimbriimonadaceae bacterium]|nr:O-antigen ligase family protein [Fimbriimonadaceae bacterium]